MYISIALLISVIFQFVAFFIAISLIPRTKYNIAWISISLGFLLMALRRLYDFHLVINADQQDLKTIISAWVAVVISVTMLLASVYIRKIFHILDRLNILRKKNESKVLSAIIDTEERERKHFAKELHDGLGPLLSNAKMNLSAVNLGEMNETNREIIQNTERIIDNAIVSAKEISNHLNPHVLERFGLKKALQNFIDSILKTAEISVNISIETANQRPFYTLEVVLYRVLCELIHNTLKYASAKNIKMSVIQFHHHLECMYEDDGIGFEVNDEHMQGMGLLNIQSRIKSAGGSIEINSKSGKGVFVKVVLPDRNLYE